ncbi:hypothetical protein FO519_007178 [Halicephalobus sp. NKZ332]|nr:hypothetical protein FO519_007178 [Halicephalobus sp. NKZ332]
MSFLRVPPPHTKLTPWVPDLIFIPISRAFERLGVYFYNRVITKTEIGLFDPRYNPKVHGPYCHWRYYGPRDARLFDVKIAELGAWIARREKTPRAVYKEFMRNVWRVHNKYYSGPVYANVVKTIFRFIFAYSFLNWFVKQHRYWEIKKMNKSFRTMSRGALIVFEGLDRSGKTTQTQKLKEYLESTGRKAVIQRFPDRSEPVTGAPIDNYLRYAKSIGEAKEAIHLLFSANRWLLKPQIEELLKSGTTVIVDRYSFSGITYTLSKDVPKEFACSPEVGLLRPDAVLFFDVDPEIAAKRGGFGDEVLEKSDFQAKVRSHMSMFKNNNYWKVINANETVDEVHEVVKEVVEKVIHESQGKLLEEMTKSDLGL